MNVSPLDRLAPRRRCPRRVGRQAVSSSLDDVLVRRLLFNVADWSTLVVRRRSTNRDSVERISRVLAAAARQRHLRRPLDGAPEGFLVAAFPTFSILVIFCLSTSHSGS